MQARDPLRSPKPFPAVVGVILAVLAASRGVAWPQSAATLWAGERLVVRLDETVTSKTARVGDRVEAKFQGPWRFKRRLHWPKGTRLIGTVAAVRAVNKAQQIPARLKLAFNQIVFPDGRAVPMDGWVESDGYGFSNGAWKAVVPGMTLGMGVAGAIVGATANGLQGAGVGAAVGGGVGLVMAGAVLKGSWKDVKIRKRRLIWVHLDQDIHIPAARPANP